MPTMSKALIPCRIALASLIVAMLSSCATTSSPTRTDFRVEDFGSSDTFSRVFPGTGKSTCEAARRALLSQGYVIVGDSNEAQVRGRKNFQPDRDVHEQIEFHVVCAQNARGSNSATAFANAVLDRYSLKKSTTSASVGVSVLGSLSVPFGSTDDALVKVASETISRRKFYDRFFEVMESYLDSTVVERAEEGVLDKAADAPAPRASGSSGTEAVQQPQPAVESKPQQAPVSKPAVEPGS
jgi:hypothetical protein